MDSSNNNIEFSDMDIQDIVDVRMALLKNKYGEVNPEDAWKSFSSQLKSNNKEMTLPFPLNRFAWMGTGIAIGIAATLLFIVLLRPFFTNTQEKDDNLIVSQAIEQPQKVIITSNILSPSVLEKEIKASTQGELIDFTKIKSENSTADERVISTPRGKVQSIILADGTSVLLNNESTLKFPSQFNGETRTVWLEGEALFSVAKDKSHPFIVKSGNLSTTALGTEFNIKSYKKQPISVSLVNGSVKVTDNNHQEIILHPGEEVSVINNKLVIDDVDVKVFKQWQEGYFYYDNVPLIDVLMEIGRWYNVNIQLQSRKLMSYRLHFIVDRNASIDDALERLNAFQYLHIERKDNTIIIKENTK